MESTQKIIEACKKNQARLIFCSTEQVFNGKENHGPFNEEESVSAVTVYGKNKIECEDLIHEQLDDYLIFRFSWMMGLSFDKVKASPSLIKNGMNAGLHQKPTLFTCHERRCMTYAKKLAQQFEKITALDTGTYHVASKNEMTTYETAVYIAKELKASDEAIVKYILPNKERYSERFRDYRLDSSKLENLGITFGTFEENIEEILKDFGWDR